MKYLYLAVVVLFVACTLALPSKISLPSEEDYANMRQNPEHYQLVFVAPMHNDDHQRHSFDPLRAYVNSLNVDPQWLRKYMTSKLTMYPELQLASDASKIKKNFDEIDKASSSFSTLNQLN